MGKRKRKTIIASEKLLQEQELIKTSKEEREKQRMKIKRERRRLKKRMEKQTVCMELSTEMQQGNQKQEVADHQENSRGKKNKKNLKGWFPGAIQVKNSNSVEGAALPATRKVSIVLFYRYVEPIWNESKKSKIIQHFVEEGSRLQLGGRARVALEGVNCTLSGLQVRPYS